MSESKQTAIQDLREDLFDTIETGNDALLEIENKEIRLICQEVLRLTLNNIIIRIDEELLETEKQQIIDAWSNGWLNDYKSDDDVKNSAEHYYDETFGVKDEQ
jgi:hypothetical protein